MMSPGKELTRSGATAAHGQGYTMATYDDIQELLANHRPISLSDGFRTLADGDPVEFDAEAEVVARNIARAITGRGTPASFDGMGACFVETGGGRAAYGKGDFYAEPVPEVKLHTPSWHWHLGKVWFEKHWLSRWF